MIQAGRRTALIVGAFVIVASALAAAILIFVGVETPFLHRRAPLEVRFRDVSGLRQGARVLVSGINVGSVARLSLAEAGTGQALITLEVSPELIGRLRADASVSLRTIGLLGDRVVWIDPGKAPEPLPPGQVLVGEEPTDPAVIFEKAGAVADRLSKVADRIDGFVREVDESRAIPNLGAAAASVRRIVSAAERGPGLVHTLLFDRTLVEDLRAATGDVRRSAASLATATRTADRSLDSVSHAARDAEQIVAHVRSGQGTLGGLIYDPTLYENLRIIVGNVGRSRLLRTLVRMSLPQGAPEGKSEKQPVRGKDEKPPPGH